MTSRAYRLGEEDQAYGAMLNDAASSSRTSSDADKQIAGTIATATAEGQPDLPGAPTAISSSSSSSSPSTPAGGGVVLNLKTLTGQVMSINLPSFDGVTILQLKQTFEAAHGIPVPLQRWIFAGREVNDSMSAAECRLENGCTVHLLLRQNQAPPMAASPGAAGVGGVRVGSGAVNSGYGEGMQFPPPYVNAGGGVLEAGLEGHANLSAGRLVELHRAYQFGRAVRIFSIIHAILFVIWALSFWPLAIGVLLCLFGYYGATNVRLAYVALYIAGLLTAVGVTTFLVVASGLLLYQIFFVLSIIVELYVLRITIRFIRLLKTFSEDERAELRYMMRPELRRPAQAMHYV